MANLYWPEGAIKTVEELEALIKQAQDQDTEIPIWQYRFSLRKRIIDKTCFLNRTRGWCRVRNRPAWVDINLAAVFRGNPAPVKRMFLFTNYWLAFGYAKRMEEKLRVAVDQ